MRKSMNAFASSLPCRPKRALLLVLALSASATVLSVALAATPAGVCDPEHPDWAMETFGLPLPTPGPIDVTPFPKALIEANYAGEHRMVSLLARGAFPQVQAYWDEMEADKEPAARLRKAMDALWAFHDRGLYLAKQVEAWRTAMPNSNAARLVHAYALLDAGSQARGSKFARETRPERMRLMSSRYGMARPLLRSLEQAGGTYADLAPIIALHLRFANGESAKAWDDAIKVVEKWPGERWLYGHMFAQARPEWSGPASRERLQQLSTLMAASKLNRAEKDDWQSVVDSVSKPPEKDPQPGAPRNYWKQRIAVLPSVFNLAQLMEYEHRMSNWPEVIAISGQILKQAPRLARARMLRAHAHKELGEQSQAYDDLLAASMLGDGWSLSTLVLAHVRGGYGLKPGDHQAMYQLCKLGAAMGNPEGANCLGAAHSEGFAGVVRSDREALRWHLLGARGNVRNSAHDVAVLLPKVIQADPESVNAAAGFWVRAAAEAGHTFAKNKLEQQPRWQEDCRVRPVSAKDNAPGGTVVEKLLSMVAVLMSYWP